MKKLTAFLLLAALLLLPACGPAADAEPTDTRSATTTTLPTESEATMEDTSTKAADTAVQTTAATTALSTAAASTGTNATNVPATAANGQTPFTVGIQVNTHGYTGTPDRAENIGSRAALQAFYRGSADPNKEMLLQPRLARYDDTFFADRALLLITRTEGSGSISHQVKSVERQGDSLVVYLTRRTPGIGTMDMAHWVIALEVRKSDIAGAARVEAVYQ